MRLYKWFAATRAGAFTSQHHKAAVWTGTRLDAAKRRTASDTTAFSNRVGCAAEQALQALQTLGNLCAGFIGLRHCGNYLPDFFVDLQVFNVLGKIVQPTEQVPGVHQGGDNRLAHTGSYTQPGLLADGDHDTVFNLLDLHGYRGFSAAGGTRAGRNLHIHFTAVSNNLGSQIAAVKISQDGLGYVCGGQVTVIDSLFHSFDYNHLR